MTHRLLYTILVTVVFFCLANTDVLGQSKERKLEVGAQFSVIRLDAFDPLPLVIGDFIPIDSFGTTEPGAGVRLTYNVTKKFALEAEGNIFPKVRTASEVPPLGASPLSRECERKWHAAPSDRTR